MRRGPPRGRAAARGASSGQLLLRFVLAIALIDRRARLARRRAALAGFLATRCIPGMLVLLDHLLEPRPFGQADRPVVKGGDELLEFLLLRSCKPELLASAMARDGRRLHGS